MCQQVCACVNTYCKASAYEIEDRGTSGNTMGRYILKNGLKYIKMYIKACKTEIFNWECVNILEDTCFLLSSSFKQRR